MMPQHNTEPVKEYEQHETLLALLNEIISITRRCTVSAEQNNLDELSALITQRDECVNKLKHLNVERYGRSNAGNEYDGEIQQAFHEVMDSSQQMLEMVERKSKSALATLTVLQQRRFYSLEIRDS